MNGAPRPHPIVPRGTTNTPPVRYGMQAQESWGPGQQDSRPLVDAQPNEHLWRLTVTGDVEVTLRWGTSAQRELVLDAPVVADLPGNVAVNARARTANGATARVTLTKSCSAGPSVLRVFVPAPGAPFALDDDAARFVALGASTVTIRGLAVVLAALQSVPLVSGSVLDAAGTGFLEFEP